MRVGFKSEKLAQPKILGYYNNYQKNFINSTDSEKISAT